MSLAHGAQHALVRAAAGALAALPPPAALGAGAALGALAGALGLRRGVARANLAIAFPELGREARDAILAAHYRELGRVLAEYPRLGARARPGAGAVAAVHGEEHLEAAAAAGRGAILMSGHYGNFELMAAHLGHRHPMAVVTRRLRNPAVDRWLTARRREAGLGTIPSETGVRDIYAALGAGRFVAMLADQDARRHGVFVPFFGRPASTAIGPARIALATGAPIIMGFNVRGPDGRHTIHVEPPLTAEEPRSPDAAWRLTARHAAHLEAWVRRHPEQWFWLHRRWKTAAPDPSPVAAPAATPATST